MDKFNRPLEDIIANLWSKVPEKHKDIAFDWNFAMLNGAVCFGKPISFNTRRLYMNSANKFWEYLDKDYQNLFQAVAKAIEDCRPEQFSTRKHIKESGVSLCKFLDYKLGEALHG